MSVLIHLSKHDDLVFSTHLSQFVVIVRLFNLKKKIWICLMPIFIKIISEWVIFSNKVSTTLFKGSQDLHCNLNFVEVCVSLEFWKWKCIARSHFYIKNKFFFKTLMHNYLQLKSAKETKRFISFRSRLEKQ